MSTTTLTPPDAHPAPTVRFSPLPTQFRHIQNKIHQLARRHGWEHTLTALHLARTLHEGQQRKTGEPYICHPLAVAWKLKEIGAASDTVLAAALLHDVLEDCSHLITAQDLRTKHGLPADIVRCVQTLTKNKAESAEQYYRRVNSLPSAILIKLADRWHNLTTMNGAFSHSKKLEYIAETERYVLPLYDACTSRFTKERHIAVALTTDVEKLARE